MDKDMEISWRSSIRTSVPLAGNSNPFAIFNTGRYGDSNFLFFLDYSTSGAILTRILYYRALSMTCWAGLRNGKKTRTSANLPCPLAGRTNFSAKIVARTTAPAGLADIISVV